MGGRFVYNLPPYGEVEDQSQSRQEGERPALDKGLHF